MLYIYMYSFSVLCEFVGVSQVDQMAIWKQGRGFWGTPAPLELEPAVASLQAAECKFAGPLCRRVFYAKPGGKHSYFLVKSEEVFWAGGFNCDVNLENVTNINFFCEDFSS